MGKHEMRKGVIVTRRFYLDELAPFLDSLRWKAPFMAAPTRGDIIVHSVTRAGLPGGYGAEVPDGVIEDIIRALSEDLETAPVQDASIGQHQRPLDTLPPINAAVFLEFLQPAFLRLEWEVSYYVNKNGTAVITGARDGHRNEVDDQVLVDAVKHTLPTLPEFDATSSSNEQQDGTITVNERPVGRVTVYDYTDILRRPENAENMKEYGLRKLTIHRDLMTDVVKPAFAERGWLYGGNHYGKKSVEIESVLDDNEQVVPLETVLESLVSLGVSYLVRPSNLVNKPGEISERSAGEFDQDESDRQEQAPAAMEAEERDLTAAEPGGVLSLREEESLTIKGHFHATAEDSERIRLEFCVGDNVITVECSSKQLFEFVDATNSLSYLTIV